MKRVQLLAYAGDGPVAPDMLPYLDLKLRTGLWSRTTLVIVMTPFRSRLRVRGPRFIIRVARLAVEERALGLSGLPERGTLVAA